VGPGLLLGEPTTRILGHITSPLLSTIRLQLFYSGLVGSVIYILTTQIAEGKNSKVPSTANLFSIGKLMGRVFSLYT
jgi:hypothetical protein